MAQRVRQDEIQLRLVINGKEVKNTINDLNKSYNQLNREIRNLTPGSAEFIAKSRELGRVKALLDDARKSAAQFNQETKGIKGALEGLGQFAGKALAPVAAAMAALGVGKIISDLSQTAVEMEAFENKAKTVFGEAINSVEAFAAKNATAMGMTRREYIAAATNAADLLIPMGFQRQEAAELSTDLVNLSGALSEWSGGQRTAKEVTETLQKALLGEREELKGLGISITEADVQTKLLEKGQKNLTGTALEQAKAMATLELIYAKSTDAQTAFSENSGTMARRQAEIRAELASMAETMASLLVPAIQKVLSYVGGFVNGLGKMADGIARFMNPAKGLTSEFAEQKQRVADLEAELPGLLDRYDELTGKSELSSEEQAELAKIIKRVGEITPEAITQIDKYGNVLGVNANKSREFLEAEKARLGFVNKEAITALEREIKLMNGRIEAEKRLIESQKVATGFNRGTGAINTRDATPREIEEALGKVRQLANEIKGAQEQLKELRGEARETPVVKKLEDIDDGGGGLGDAEKKRIEAERQKRIEAIKKAAEAEAKARGDAEKALNELTIDLMEDGLQKEIAQIRLRETERIEAVKGSDEQRIQQIILIEQQTEREISALRSTYTQQEIARINTDAQTRIETLTGTEEEILAKRISIETQAREQISQVIERSTTDQVAYVRESAQRRREAIAQENQETLREIQRIEQETQTAIRDIQSDETLSESVKAERIAQVVEVEMQRKEVLLSSANEISSKLIEIEQETQRAIRDIQANESLSESVKAERIAQVVEVEMQRKEVLLSSAGESAEQLLEIERKLSESLTEVYATRTTQIEQAETLRAEREKEVSERIYDERIARLKAQAERESLEIYQSTERQIAEAVEIEDQEEQAERIEAIQEELKDRLLQGEIDFQQQKLEIMRSAGMDVVAEESRLAQLQIQIAEAKAKKFAEIEKETAAQRRSRLDQDFQEQSGQFEAVAEAAAQFGEAASQVTIANLETRKQRELEIAGDNEEKRLEIEKRYNELRIQEEKRAKERQKPITIAQIVINTAQAVSKIWAEAGVAAPILIPLVLATGAAQVATVLKQKFFGGGFTGKAPAAIAADETGAKPVGVVHEKEWVASRAMVEDPVTGPIIAELESERVKRFGGQPSQPMPALAAPRTAAEIVTMGSYAIGGYTATTTAPSDAAVSAVKTDSTGDAMLSEIRAMRMAWSSIQFVTVWGEREADINNDITNRLQGRRNREILQ